MLERPTPFGPLLVSCTVTGQCNRFEAIHPLAMLWHACDANGSYSMMLKAALRQRPPTIAAPWRFAAYADEVTPGNVVSPDNLRKVWVIYWALIDCSRQSLHKEDAWFLLAAKRSSEVKKISGGIAAMFKECLKLFFTGGANDVSTVGVHFEFPDGEAAHLWLRLDQIVQDDGAHKAIWCCVGASGSRFCMLCQNAFARASGEVDSDNEEILVNDVTHVSGLHLATEATIHESLDKLDAYHVEFLATPKSKTWFREREQALGFKYEPHSVLRDDALKSKVQATKQFVHDWMHVMAVSGVINVTLFLVIAACAAAGVGWEQFREYVAAWFWPKGQQNPASILTPKRVTAYKKVKKIKCQASELISILPVIALFIQLAVIPAGVAVDACMVLLCLADVLDLLMATPRGNVNPKTLQDAVEKFLDKFKETFGTKPMITKFHSMLHFALELDRFGMLLTCWVQERKHKMVRTFCNDILKTRVFERSVLGNVVCQHMHNLKHRTNFEFAAGLVGGRPAYGELKNMVLSTTGLGDWLPVDTALFMRSSAWTTTGIGDAVLYMDGASMGAGIVWVHVEANGVPMTMVRPGDCQRHDGNAGYSVWRLQAEPMWIESTDIFDPCVFTWEDVRTVRILLPSYYR